MITLAVDCMGGDHGPRVTLPACRHFLDRYPDAALLLVGLPASLAEFAHPRATVVAASEVAGGVVARVGGVGTEAVGGALRELLADLPALLGDDPLARKW